MFSCDCHQFSGYCNETNNASLQCLPVHLCIPHFWLLVELQPLRCSWLGSPSPWRYHSRYTLYIERLGPESGYHRTRSWTARRLQCGLISRTREGVFCFFDFLPFYFCLNQMYIRFPTISSILHYLNLYLFTPSVYFYLLSVTWEHELLTTALSYELHA